MKGGQVIRGAVAEGYVSARQGKTIEGLIGRLLLCFFPLTGQFFCL